MPGTRLFFAEAARIPRFSAFVYAGYSNISSNREGRSISEQSRPFDPIIENEAAQGSGNWLWQYPVAEVHT